MRSGKLGWQVFIVVTIFAIATVSYADTEAAVRDVLKTMSGPNAVDNPRTASTPEGYLSFLGAPTGNSFEPLNAGKGSDAAASAKQFLRDHKAAFGVQDGVSFSTDRVKSINARTFVRLNQTYNGVPVFGAQVIVQLMPGGTVTTVLSDIMRDAPRVYSGEVSLTPTLNIAEGKLAATADMESVHPGHVFETNEPALNLYVPYVIGAVGQARLVYIVEVESVGPGMPIAERLLIDAHNGSAVLRIPMIYSAKFRTIFDAENAIGADPGILKRSEGQGPANITDVDNAYDFYGDTYDFYQAQHGRDSIDDNGATMDATVRLCPDSFNCPYLNAFWDGTRMYFGDGFTVDDVVGHELTHGVTQNESNLIYSYESGALNESFSDVWGEFIDQTNGKGDDSPGVKWLMGEDVPVFGALRDMKNPPAFSDPDTYLGPFWKFSSFDNGGVHSNSGVSNKVCYLLTDGDTFNGYTVDGMGIATVADLYYECQTNLLGQSSNYPDFGNQMVTAAQNLGLSQDEIGNVTSALIATKILKFEFKPLRHFRATGNLSDARIALTWSKPTGGVFTGVDIVRNTSRFPLDSTDGVAVASITNDDESFVDNPGVGAGADAYYGIFPRSGSNTANVPLFARGTVGVDVDFLTQGFTKQDTDTLDLEYSQITIVPTGEVPVLGPAAQLPEDYFNYTTYAAHGATDSKIAPEFDGNLPVAKEDSFQLPLTDESVIELPPSPVPIPFFGRLVSNFVLSSNGYLAAAADQYTSQETNSTISLANHFEVPRISFLMSDLNPRSGGEIWARYMDDRIVITFENVPSYDLDSIGGPGQRYGNTVQCELFFGGQIRFTYGALNAERAIVGISDGNGTPLDVNAVLNGQEPGVKESDLSGLPEGIPLELQPIAIRFVEPGTIVAFTASAESAVGPPQFSMFSVPGIPDMDDASLGLDSGEFLWDTTDVPDGGYAMIMCASAGDYSSCQSFAVIVTSSVSRPTATDVRITPKLPRDNDDLVAHYEYHHPSILEGPTTIYWMKSGSVMSPYTNAGVLPRTATKAGDQWSIQVLPVTIAVASNGITDFYLYGDPVVSESVFIEAELKVDANGDGKVNSVDLQLVVGGLLGTARPGVDPDVNGDGSEDAADVQTTINFILEKR